MFIIRSERQHQDNACPGTKIAPPIRNLDTKRGWFHFYSYESGIQVTAIAEKQSVVSKEARGKYASAVITPNICAIDRFINVEVQRTVHTKYAGMCPGCLPANLRISGSMVYHWSLKIIQGYS